jgi:hypothetical protein
VSVHLGVAIELTEIDVHESGVEKCYQPAGKQGLKGLSFVMEVIDVVLEPNEGIGQRRRIVQSRYDTASFFLGGETSH